MNIKIKAITTSVLLSTLLMTGCGGSSSSTSNDLSTPKIEVSIPKVEESKEDLLKKELRSDGVEYKTSAYSQDKSEILLAGIKDGKTTIYKFDASSLELIEKFSFDIDGLLDIKSEDDGKYTITAQDGSSADNFIFDSVSGELIKNVDNSEQELKDMLSNQVENLVAYSYSKHKNGIFAIGKNDEGRYDFYRFGMETGTPILEKKFEESTYGVRYDFGKTIITNSSIKPLEDGKFMIFNDFGTYIFDYLKGSGEWTFEDNIKYTHAYDDTVLDILKDYDFQSFGKMDSISSAIDAGDNFLIVTVKVRTNGLYNDYRKFSIDLSNHKVTYIVEIHSIIEKHIDSSNHILTYVTKPNYFSQSSGIVKYDYKKGKIIDSASISVGMGI